MAWHPSSSFNHEPGDVCAGAGMMVSDKKPKIITDEDEENRLESG